jgi:hypothetical protein
MAREASQVIAAVAVGYGVAAALSVLLQARQMLARGSCDVSAPFLGAYVGGYATWLLYGLSVRNVPIIVVDAVGLVCGAFTLVVALRLRGRLVSPARRLGLGRATRRFGDAGLDRAAQPADLHSAHVGRTPERLRKERSRSHCPPMPPAWVATDDDRDAQPLAHD